MEMNTPMSFKLGRFFYLTISFILGAFFFVIGVFGIILPWSPFLQKVTSRFIEENTLMLSLFGLGFSLIGISVVVYTLLNTRRCYTHIRTGAQAVILDENVIQQYLEAYWLEQFPNTHVAYELSIRKNSIQIVADLPALPLSEQKQFLEKVKHDFSESFWNCVF